MSLSLQKREDYQSEARDTHTQQLHPNNVNILTNVPRYSEPTLPSLPFTVTLVNLSTPNVNGANVFVEDIGFFNLTNAPSALTPYINTHSSVRIDCLELSFSVGATVMAGWSASCMIAAQPQHRASSATTQGILQSAQNWNLSLSNSSFPFPGLRDVPVKLNVNGMSSEIVGGGSGNLANQSPPIFLVSYTLISQKAVPGSRPGEAAFLIQARGTFTPIGPN